MYDLANPTSIGQLPEAWRRWKDLIVTFKGVAYRIGPGKIFELKSRSKFIPTNAPIVEWNHVYDTSVRTLTPSKHPECLKRVVEVARTLWTL